MENAESSGKSAGLLAAATDRYSSSAMKAALEAGGDPNARDANGAPALSLATLSGNHESVRELLRAGADTAQANRRGWTALHEAVGAKDPRMVKLLLAAGASVDAFTEDGDTPASIAAERGRHDASYQPIADIIADARERYAAQSRRRSEEMLEALVESGVAAGLGRGPGGEKLAAVAERLRARRGDEGAETAGPRSPKG